MDGDGVRLYGRVACAHGFRAPVYPALHQLYPAPARYLQHLPDAGRLVRRRCEALTARFGCARVLFYLDVSDIVFVLPI